MIFQIAACPDSGSAGPLFHLNGILSFTDIRWKSPFKTVL